jgi:hypothetical protein
MFGKKVRALRESHRVTGHLVDLVQPCAGRRNETMMNGHHQVADCLDAWLGEDGVIAGMDAAGDRVLYGQQSEPHITGGYRLDYLAMFAKGNRVRIVNGATYRFLAMRAERPLKRYPRGHEQSSRIGDELGRP